MTELARSAVIFDTSKFISALDCSTDPEDACPKIEKTSKISDLPALDPVPLVVNVDLKALLIVLSALEKYLFMLIVQSLGYQC
jgi:hypothetical protein